MTIMNCCTHSLSDLLLHSKVLEATAIHIEERKTGGIVQTEKVYPWDAALLTRLLDELKPPLAEYKVTF